MTSAAESPRNLADRLIRQTLPRPPHLRAFLREVVPALADGFDCDRARLVDREIVLPDWRRREADLPFEIPYHAGAEEIPALVYVLIEHQSDTEALLPLRMLFYAVAYWERQWKEWEKTARPRPPLRLHPVLPIVLYTGATPWGSNRTLAEMLGQPAAFHAFAPSWQPLFWNLSERTAQSLVDDGEQWLQLLALMRATGEEAADFRVVCAEAWRRVKLESEQDLERWEELCRAMLSWAQGRRPAAERDALNAIAAASQPNPDLQRRVITMTQTIAESLIEEGVAKGRVEGRVEGQLLANRETLRRLLTQRFAPLPEPIVQRIEAASDLERLQAALDQVLQLKSLDELDL